MSPIAALAIVTLGVAAIAAVIAMVVRSHSPQHVRAREVKAAKEEARALRTALDKIEEQAVANPDGFILNTDVLKITRSI